MSKEQRNDLSAAAPGLARMIGLLLVLGPLGAEAPPRDLLWQMLGASLAAVIAAKGVWFLMEPSLNRRPWFWMPLLLSLSLPRLMPVFPFEVELALLLFPFALLLNASKQPPVLRVGLPLLLGPWVAGWIGGGSGDLLHHLSETQRIVLFLWVMIPFWFCLRKPWRVFAVPLSRFTTVVFLAGLFLVPLTQWVPLSFKTPAEAETRERGTPPAPRFRPSTEEEAEDAIPSGFTPELLRFLHGRQEALREEALLELFAEAPIPPDEMVRAMRVYGFLQRDPLGFHVPSEAFRLDPAENIVEDYVVWVDRLLDHASLAPEDLDGDLFLAAMRGRLLVQARPGLQRFRLSADFRAALENGLRPRQILTLLEPETPGGSVSIEEYGRRWNLGLADAEAELNQLAEGGFVRPVRWEMEAVAAPTFVPDPAAGRRILIRMVGAALGLLILWKSKEPGLRVWIFAGAASVYGYTASLLAASAPHLPGAAATVLWLTPPALLLLFFLSGRMAEWQSGRVAEASRL